jgi:hypothetical protein
MLRREALSIFLAFSLALPALAADMRPVNDAEVKKGIQQVDDGDYDSAIFTLDTASRRLAAAKIDSNDLAQAYLYLGIAYLGKGREAAAKAQFREAIGEIKDLTLSADRFPPKVIDLFAAAKDEVAHNQAAANSPAPATATAAAPSKKGGGHKGLLIGGLALAVGGGVALAAGSGGGSSSGSSSSGSPGLQTMTFTGTVADQQGYQIVATKSGTLTATARWTNGQVSLNIGCQEHDPPYTGCNGAFNRTTNTSAQYTAAVTQKTYDIFVQNFGGPPESYTLTVTFP